MNSAPVIHTSLALLLVGCAATGPHGEALDPREAWLLERGFQRTVEGAWRSSHPPAAAPRFLRPEDADDHHSRVGHWRTIGGGRFDVRSTCDLATGEAAARVADATFEALERIYGVSPLAPPTVIVLRSRVQYNAFAVTEPEIGELHPDGRGLAATHHAFVADQWLDRRRDLDHPGAGVTYWDDLTDAGNGWGPLAVRHAAALAFAEAIDPSPVTVARFRQQVRRDPGAEFPVGDYWREKRLPEWVRHGVATFVERFARDPQAADPDALRRWSLGRLEELGGPVSEDALRAMALQGATPAFAERLRLSAGAEVARRLDRGEAPLAAALHPATRP